MKFTRELAVAVQFLTRIPVPSSAVLAEAETQGRSVLYYPLVGALIGGLLCVLFYSMGGDAGILRAALILTLWVGVTGALHIDGLADLADGWVGGHGDRERTLEIMKDSRSGPVAVVLVTLLLLVKFAALDVLVERGVWSALLLVPVIGRAGLVAALCYLPYARPGGIGEVLANHLPRDRAGRVLAASALLLPLFWGWVGLLILLLITGFFLLLRQALNNRLGGITGDAAGAVCELLEAVALVFLVLLVN